MFTTDTLVLFGPPVLILIVVAWGAGLVIFLKFTKSISVLTVVARDKTAAEIGLAIVALVLDGYLLLRPFVPTLDEKLYAVPSPIPLLGIAVMSLGILLVMICQMGMGSAWRIGVPVEKEKSQSLITTGIYAYSRNPIYLGIMMFIIGTSITVPGPITLICLVASAVLITPIIKREEAFLKEAFGDAYFAYCQQVRRWL